MALSTATRGAMRAAFCSEAATDEVADILEVNQVLSATEAGFLDSVTAGTATASKALVLDANKDIATIRHLTLSGNLVSGSTTISETDLQAIDGVIATPAEINRVADVSTRIVSLAATSLAVTALLHSDKVIVLNHTGAASTCTLPDATGSGAVFRFIVGAVNTSNHVITVPDASNTIKGSVNLLDNDSNAQTAYAATGTDDTITLNGTTTGGQIGDWVELVDIAADTWAIRGQLICPAGSNVADPFSAAV